MRNERHARAGFVALAMMAAAGCAGGGELEGTTDGTQAFSNNPAIAIEGSDMRWAAQLYEAMRGAPESERPHEFIEIRVRTLPGLVCERYSTGSNNPLSPGTVQHSCKVEANLSEEKLAAIFAKLKVDAVAGRGSMLDGREVKVVGGLVLVKSPRGHALLSNAPCRTVNPDDTAAAARCLRFWATDVFPASAAPNVAGVTLSTDAKTKLTRVLETGGPALTPLPERWDETVRRTEFVGAIVQSTDAGHVAYFTIDFGQQVVPHEIAEADLAKVEGGFRAEHVGDWSLGILAVKRGLEAKLR
jgi:hypothetical protein